MTTALNRVRARLLAYASDCYARGWSECGSHLARMIQCVRMAAMIGHDGRGWAQSQSSAWAPYRGEEAQQWGWAYAILDVVAREEAGRGNSLFRSAVR